nr:MAG TPA: hypothetical protein [Caudoviricetes sp.]
MVCPAWDLCGVWARKCGSTQKILLGVFIQTQ